MRTGKITVQLLSYWHVGSGMGRGAEMDALVLKSRDGLPYLPGRTLKGLLRDGMQTAEEVGLLEPGTTNDLLGTPTKEGDPSGSKPGILWLTDAVLPDAERNWLSSDAQAECRNSLYDAIASTSLDENGIADDRTLRNIEVAVPVTLEARAEGPDKDPWLPSMQKAAVFVRALGSHRNRGFGRCKITISE